LAVADGIHRLRRERDIDPIAALNPKFDYQGRELLNPKASGTPSCDDVQIMFLCHGIIKVQVSLSFSKQIGRVTVNSFSKFFI
jgi:hypothetical protein